MIAMSFFLVKNYRMTEAFEFVNWSKMLTRGYFWDSYWHTIWIAGLATVVHHVRGLSGGIRAVFPSVRKHPPHGRSFC